MYKPIQNIKVTLLRRFLVEADAVLSTKRRIILMNLYLQH